MADNKEFTITKKISSLGENNILIIPKVLREQLQPGTVVEATIKVLSEPPVKKKRSPAPKKKPSVTTKKVTKKIAKSSDEGLIKIIKSLIEKGYSTSQITAVLVKNGYKETKINAVLAELEI